MYIKKLKFISITALIISLTTSSLAQAASFSDTNNLYYEGAVESLVETGVLTAGGKFNGAEKATRGTVIEWIVKNAGIEISVPEKPTFKDVPFSHPASQYIETAFFMGWVTGDRDSKGNLTYTFRPNDPINRAEIATMIVKINAGSLIMSNYDFEVFTDVKAGSWYKDAVETAYKFSIVNGYANSNGQLTGNFGPADPVLRQDAAIMIVKTNNPQERETVKAIISTSDSTTSNTSNNPNGIKLITKATAKTGEIGKNAFIDPQSDNDSDWLFGPQVEWIMDASCNDSGDFIGSTGEEYDNGAMTGRANAYFHKNLLFPIYDPSISSGSTEYKKGYVWAYEQTYQGYLALEKSCPAPADLSLYNKQGWIKAAHESLSFNFFLPPSPYTYTLTEYNPNSELYMFEQLEITKGAVMQVSLNNSSAPLDETEWNKGKTININNVEFVELNLDGKEEDPAVTAQDYYDIIIDGLSQSVIGKQCTVSEAAIKSTTINGHAVAELEFQTVCPSQAENHLLYFYQLDNNNIAIFLFENTDDNSSISAAIMQDKNFAEQFLNYVNNK